MDALKEAIAKLDPELGPISLDAKWVYAIQTNGESFDPEELKRAATLLNADGVCDRADFFVTPRKGTISPWSSKATDIFRNCGLKSILRVERVRRDSGPTSYITLELIADIPSYS